MSKHTKLPWEVRTNVRLPTIHGGDGRCVASTGSSYSRPENEIAANAQLIVRAVNAHGDLLAAAQLALNYIALTKFEPDEGSPPVLRDHTYDKTLEQLRSAISKAEGAQ